MRKDDCQRCQGSGWFPSLKAKCISCKGKGWIEMPQQEDMKKPWLVEKEENDMGANMRGCETTFGGKVVDQELSSKPQTEYHHPSHYNRGKYEVIDVIEDWNLGFNDGNAIKYIGRHRWKGNPQADLKKAFWYLTRELLVAHGVAAEELMKVVEQCRKK